MTDKANETRTSELASQLAARRYAGYGYGYGYPGHVGYHGALSPHRSAYYGMSEHLRAEERFLDQRRTLYNDLRTAESREASAIEKRLQDEQTTATRLAEEHDAARRAAEAEAIAARAAEEHRLRAAEAKATAERAAEAAAALKRAEAASERASQARDAEIKAANDKAKEARDAESSLAAAIQGKKVNFSKVLKMIDEMVVTLKAEQQDDNDKKEYCEAQFDLSDDKKKGLERSVANFEKAIEKAKETIAALKDELAGLAAGIKALDKSVAEATEQRKEENEDFTALMASDSAAKELLGFAKNRAETSGLCKARRGTLHSQQLH